MLPYQEEQEVLPFQVEKVEPVVLPFQVLVEVPSYRVVEVVVQYLHQVVVD